MRILLITHEASRSGAPRVAILVERALVDQGHAVTVTSRRPGPLLGEFAEVAPTRVEALWRTRSRLRARAPLRWLAYLLDTAVALGEILRRRPHLVYVNSTAASIYLRPARWLRRTVVLHVHESGGVASPFLSYARAWSTLPHARVVACSSSVHRDLSALPGLQPERVLLVPSIPDSDRTRELAAMGLDVHFADDEVVVGGCGTVEPRKGIDLLGQAARLVKGAVASFRVRFVWVGDVADPSLAAQVSDVVELLGPRANPYPLMARFDVAALPSRDDPFPLVVLESMALGVPVVGFDVGGVARQMADAGVVVAAGDVTALASAITELIQNEERRRALGSAARSRVDRHFSMASFAAGIGQAVRSADCPG